MFRNRLNDQGISTWFRKQGITNLYVLNINLSDRKLKKISKYIDKFVRLRDLNLSKNALNSLPSTIECCGSLLTIHLTHNKFLSFPSVLFKNKNIQAIKLKYNSIEKLNQSDTDLLSYSNDLRNLDLSHNNLKKFVISGERNLKLDHIYCGHNPKLRYFEHTSSNNLVYLDIGIGVRELTLDNIKLGRLNSLERIYIPKQKGQTNMTNERSARLTISNFVARNPTLQGNCRISVCDGNRVILELTANEVGNRRANRRQQRQRNKYLLKSGDNGTTIWYSYFSPQQGPVNLNDKNVNKNDLFFIDSDVTRNNVIRHLWHKKTVNNGVYPTVRGSATTYEQPLTKAHFWRNNMKMLKDYRYFIDRNIPANNSNSNNSNSNANRSLNNMARSANVNLSRILLRISQTNNVALTNVSRNNILQKFYRRMNLLRGESRDEFYKLFKGVVFRYFRPQDKKNAFNYYRQANLISG